MRDAQKTPDSVSRRQVVTMAAGAAATGLIAAPLIAGRALAAPPRVRRDATLFGQDAANLAKFAAAVKEMQDRSTANPADPKGWLVNAQAHRDFCAIPAAQMAQIHFCWWFLPWHRAYIAVTERKLREISGDPSLVYPYWNWSSDRKIPQAFATAGSPLAKAVRFTPNRALTPGEIDYNPNDPILKALVVSALESKVFQAANPAAIRSSFGGIARPNPQTAYGNNRLEGTPHGPVHGYVGGQNGGVGGDMSDFATAARDPIFFAHHGNLDRLWEIWRQVPAHKASEPTSAAFRNHSFPFTWLDGTVVKVSVADCLDTQKLGYVYDNLSPLRPGTQPPTLIAQAAGDRLPPVARGTVTAPVGAQGAGPARRQLLEISGVAKPAGLITVGVYVKPVGADPEDTGMEVGVFSAVLAGGEIAWPSPVLTFDITAAVDRFAGQKLDVELVPYRLSAQGAETYPPLAYAKMRIYSEAR